MTDPWPPQWKRIRIVALALGAAAAIGCAVFAWIDLKTFLGSYLLAFLAAFFVPSACMGLLALGNLTGGQWAIASRPVLTAGTDTTPLVALLFIPIALGVDSIYVWATSEGQAFYEGAKAKWLSPEFFLGRSAAYLVIWLLICLLLVRCCSVLRVPGETIGMRRVGAASLLVLIAVATLAAFDWGMSLEPEWYSSIYGAMLAISGVVAAHSLVALVLCSVDVRIFAPFEALAAPPALPAASDAPQAASKIRGDVGNLLLAFVMLWAYFSFSQFLIIWSGNLPSEILWYVSRLANGWEWLALVLVALHFVLPFLLLLSRQVKRSTGGLPAVAWLLLVMYILNLFWIIKPAFAPDGITIHLADIACIIAVGGIWTAAFLWRLERRWAAMPVSADVTEGRAR